MNGAPGLRAVEQLLPRVREELAVDFCVTNGENAADGLGITPRLAERILAAGTDVITLGNHSWRRKEVMSYLGETDLSMILLRQIDPHRQDVFRVESGIDVAQTQEAVDEQPRAD